MEIAVEPPPATMTIIEAISVVTADTVMASTITDGQYQRRARSRRHQVEVEAVSSCTG